MKIYRYTTALAEGQEKFFENNNVEMFEVPKNAQLREIGATIDDKLSIWCEVDPEEKETVILEVFKINTGQDIPDDVEYFRSGMTMFNTYHLHYKIT